MHYVADWSSKQLLKHRVELQGLLGNFYLRIISEKIAARLPPSHQHVPLDRAILLKQQSRNADLNSEATVTAGSENGIGNNAGHLDELRASLTELTKTVDGHLQNLEVADALEAIIACLKIVCGHTSFDFLLVSSCLTSFSDHSGKQNLHEVPALGFHNPGFDGSGGCDLVPGGLAHMRDIAAAIHTGEG